MLSMLTKKSRGEYEFFVKSVIVLNSKKNDLEVFKNIDCSVFQNTGECTLIFDNHECNLSFNIKDKSLSNENREKINSDWKGMINSCKIPLVKNN